MRTHPDPATAPTPPAGSGPAGPARLVQRLTIAGVVALIALGLAWELWLAPQRPGGTMLALKVLPLALALPALLKGRIRAYQLWTMLILVYLCEGVVRSMSDTGWSRWLGVVELVLAVALYAGLLGYVRLSRRDQQVARPQ